MTGSRSGIGIISRHSARTRLYMYEVQYIHKGAGGTGNQDAGPSSLDIDVSPSPKATGNYSVHGNSQ